MFTYLFHLQLFAQVLFVVAILLGMLFKRGGQLTFVQVHHAYWGALLYVAGLLLEMLQHRPAALTLESLALAVSWDDAGEHWAQLVTRQANYAAPLKALFYATLAAVEGLFRSKPASPAPQP